MAAITITFGSFRPMNTGCTLPPAKAVATPVRAAPPKTDYVESGRKLIAEYDQKVNKAFSSLESINNHIKRGTYATISRKVNRVQLKYPTMSAVQRILMREEEEKRATAAFLSGAPMIVSHITIGGGPAPSIAEALEPKRSLNKTRSNRQRMKPITPVRCTAHQLNKLVLEVGQLSAVHGLSIEVVDKHATKLGRRFRHGRLHLAARTAHHDNRILPCDCPTTPWAQGFIYKLATAYEPAAITGSNIEPGDSGLVAIKRDRKGFGGDNSLFIVRGRLNNSLVNALDTLSKHDITRINHYSKGDQFFNSFAESYVANKPSWLDHECSSDLNIRECGTVAGLVCQALMPSGKITCSACSWRLGSVSQEEYWKLVDERMTQCERQIQEKHPLFSHASSLINTIRSGRRFPALNVEAYGTVHKIVGQQKNSPLGNIAKINDVLIKGAQATPEQSGAALENLLELTRYLKNRSDTIEAGDIKHFRNKISAKTHVNPVLMCDNQLDKNGNFVWGERGYHAKRFFANYFNQITPGNDYEEWIERAGPNGSRKLGIGNLVVSTDMAKFRQQLRGEAIERQPVSEACCSRIGTNFIYPVCCVTHDSGEPVYSELMMPTKNHLVIGNTGDQKFLDLPAGISDNLYMAKEGYCYLNMFLAMLVNVDEKDAKAFTKMVRDIVVPRLQKWPTAIDLATMCAFLAVFFPAIGAAELPKILVDHATKTMHVTDAYGSLTTGYHILKASTVNHFVKFANDDLQGEMKTYRIGGTPQSNNANVMTFVMKSIYKPKLMEQALRDEPYLLVAGMLSPAVLVALHNSGSLERCIEIWVGRSRGLVEMAVVLTGLAKRVSRAKLFADQIKILQDGAPRLTSAIVDGFQLNVSYMYAIQTLGEISARREADEALVANQFQNLLHESQELVEKIYVKELEVYWQELSWREKFSVFWESRRRSQSRIAYVEPETETAFIATSTVSFRPYVQRVMRSARKRVSDSVEACQRKAWRLAGRAFCSLMGIPRILIPDLQTLLNVAVVISASMTTIMALQRVITEHQKAKRAEASLHESKQRNRIHIYYQAFKKFCEKHPNINEHTSAEFYQYLKYYDTGLAEFYVQSDEDIVLFQAKRKEEAQLEGIIATIALALMVFDAERSDCAYRVLNKIKNLVQTADEGVTFQGEKEIDEILNSLEEKNQTVDFELNIERPPPSLTEPTFQEWWNKQLTNGCTVPHYRTEGHFLEFTRATAAITAHNIVHDTEHKDFLVRGAVGSGKSTGLPFHLSKKGSVLVLEPTRPLAENVTKQLKGEPFFASPTMRMRGSSIFGHTNITIMTSGFALHFYANNLIQLKDIDFIIIDECHVNDSAAIAFRNLLVHHEYQGKVIKTSATPPGREVEFETQKPVTVVAEEQLSFQGFVEAQGSGSNADVIKRGSNILIYVASYNEVDRLSDMLVKRQFKVSKVDGRTMKVGRTEIETHGVPGKPHFIVATNIIENGVTLDIDVVVDFGVKVVPFLDVDNRMMAYNKVPISYGERIQRCGRVGRHKPGVALRVGPTMKGLSEVPPVIATEAAFLCFTYGLPVTTQGVSTSLLSSVTMRQARTMNHFELPIFYTAGLVRYDGAMHPAIHEILKPFKLRDSDIVLNKLAIPNEVVSFWMSGAAYQRATGHNTLQESTRVPFLSKDVPDKVHEAIWSAVTKFRKDGGIGRMTSAQACKVAYTLQTDIWSIPRTVQTIDHLLAREHEKKAYFQTVVQHVSTTSGFSLAGILRSIQSRYAEDHTTSNIETLERAKAQLLEYKNISSYSETPELLRSFGYLETVTFQSENDIATFLNLGGFWKKSLIAKDFIVAAAVAAGSFWLIGTWAYNKCKEGVGFQGYNKRQRQKLKFREARQDKMGRVAYGDDDTIEQIFGPAYTAKGKKSGKTKGMGVKTRRFTNMYGFDPTEYSFIRFLDPLTGATLDESPYTDISVIQERFGELRSKQIIEGELEMDAVNYKPGITAYFVKEGAKKALKVDLTPHIPLKVCDRAAAVAGFPEREGQLRQTGTPQVVDTSDVPAEKDVVEFEARSLAIGLRDYNPIARSVAQLHNESPEEPTRLFGIGFGTVIITNQHLLRYNNGGMTITTQYGTFKVHASCQLKVHPLAGRDIALIQLPKDQPPFPCKLQFRKPEDGERVVMVSTNFQTKNATSIVSDSSSVAPVHNSSFWRYWISTKDGQCGNPIVATSDGKIVGIHSLASTSKQNNFFVGFPEDFGEILCSLESLEWTKGWKLNIDSLSWGSLRFKEDKPGGMFKTAKLVEDLVGFQGGWMMEAACGNLRPVAYCPNQLVTKHVVLGKCQHFQKYLATHVEADQFFKPLLGAYQPSKLNKEAFIKDIMKYSSVITVGAVDCATFDLVVHSFIDELGELGFKDLEYVTDELAIFRSLNMKASVGALYAGKKRDYFKDYTPEDMEAILRESCERLYKGQMGLWNGSLKAELRPLEKTLENKTRVFTAAPLDSLLGGKVCVDDFNNHFYSKNLQGPWTVGMTKFYAGWDKLMSLLPEGWVYCDADGSQFDSSLSPYLLNAVLTIRLRCMEKWHIGEVMLSNLYTEILYTPIATPDGTVLKKFKGNNSGQPSTVVDNTLMVVLAMKYALCKSGIELTEQNDVCRFFVNGDDLIIALHPGKAHILDSFSELFLQLGLKYDFSTRTQCKTDLWFMSHQAMHYKGILIPKLEKERVVSILEWNRSEEPVHRLEAICAAMIEAWGHEELLHQVRLFYQWLLSEEPFDAIDAAGVAPYITEPALHNLYCNTEVGNSAYIEALAESESDDEDDIVVFQGKEDERVDAGASGSIPSKNKEQAMQQQPVQGAGPSAVAQQINSTKGTFSLPRIERAVSKMRIPRVGGKALVNLDHLIAYKPDAEQLYNTRATEEQLAAWVSGIKRDLDIDDDAVQLVLNGFMVWCIENGTSPNMNGSWVMIEGNQQVVYPLKPMIENAQPSLRQIMAHFSDLAESYIEMRNKERPYMPRYGLVRNLNDMGLARYAFDFYEMNSRTPPRAREAHIQMKAAALRGKESRLFGLDGGVSTTQENTEHHTTGDVNAHMHSLLGVRMA